MSENLCTSCMNYGKVDFCENGPMLACSKYVSNKKINDCFFIGFYSISFVINMIIHAVVDDLKANRFVINLTIDQTIHLFQIIITFDFFCVLV